MSRGTEPRSKANMVDYDCSPCTIAEENANGGWSKLAAPEGSDRLAEILTAGSRGGGPTGQGGNKTVSRTKANRKVID